jgi:hypothetical protein
MKEITLNEKEVVTIGKIKQLLVELGIPVNVKGFNYLASSILELSKERNKISVIHSKIALLYDTTDYSVEKNMRYAISKSLLIVDKDTFKKVFGESLEKLHIENKANITASHYMYSVLEYLQNNNKKLLPTVVQA